MVEINNLEAGTRVKNPSQRSGTTFEVVDIREERTFDGTETVFVVRRVSNKTGEVMGLEGDGDVIYEKDHGRWELV